MSIEKYSATAERYRKLVVDSCSLSLRAIGYIPDVWTTDFCTVSGNREKHARSTARRIIAPTYRDPRWSGWCLKAVRSTRVREWWKQSSSSHWRAQTTKVNATGDDESFYKRGNSFSRLKIRPPWEFKSRQLFLFALSFPQRREPIYVRVYVSRKSRKLRRLGRFLKDAPFPSSSSIYQWRARPIRSLCLTPFLFYPEGEHFSPPVEGTDISEIPLEVSLRSLTSPLNDLFFFRAALKGLPRESYPYCCLSFRWVNRQETLEKTLNDSWLFLLFHGALIDL